MTSKLEGYVTPFYLKMMRTNAAREGGKLLPQILKTGAQATPEDVLALLHDPWRSTVMGAWLSLLHQDEAVTEAVLMALSHSHGSLDAPPLATAAVVLAPERALPTLIDYVRRDLANQWGAAGFVAASIEHLGADTGLCRPAGLDRDDFASLLALANRIREHGATTNSTQINLAALTPRQLLSLYSQILTELISRQVTRSRNAPAGDYAELLVAEQYGGKLASGSAKSYDVVVSGGRTIQVKSLVVAEGDKRSHSYSPFRTFDFDACVFVVFDSVDYRVVHAIEIESVAVEAMARDAKWVAGRRVNVRQVLASEDARDLTTGLQAAQDFIDEHRTFERLG